VVTAAKPTFQVAENKVDHRKVFFRDCDFAIHAKNHTRRNLASDYSDRLLMVKIKQKSPLECQTFQRLAELTWVPSV